MQYAAQSNNLYRRRKKILILNNNREIVTMKYSLMLVMLLSLVGCGNSGSKLIGKWTSESSFAKYMGGDKELKITPSNIIEFTATEKIHHGNHEPIEMVDEGNDVIVYKIIMGQKVGETYKFIDNNTVVKKNLFDTITYHRIAE